MLLCLDTNVISAVMAENTGVAQKWLAEEQKGTEFCLSQVTIYEITRAWLCPDTPENMLRFRKF